MRKFLIKFLAVITVLCVMLSAACAQESKTDATLVDFTDVTISAEYGSTYNVNDYVYDTDGVRYTLSATVKDGDGNKVEFDDGFTVTDESYTVTYKVSFNGETVKKVVTVNAYSKPMITINRSETVYGLGLPYLVPSVTVTDYIDGDITDFTKEIYYVDYYEEEKLDYNGTASTFMPEKLGNYYLKVTATNSTGVTNSVKVYFTVKTPGVRDFIPSEENAANFTYGQYVSNDQIPTEGITNTVGYTGNAVKSVQKSGLVSDIVLDCSATEYEAMYLRGDINTVTFNFLMVAPITEKDGVQGERVVLNNEGTDSKYYGLLTAAGILDAIPANEWQTVSIKLQDFIKAMRSVDTDEQTLIFGRIWTDERDTVIRAPEFYLGDITFSYVEPILLDVETCSAGSTLKQVYNGYWNKTLAQRVANADLPVNDVYSGSALSLSIGSNYSVYATLNYTVAEMEELKNKYDRVAVWALFTDNDGNRTPSGGIFTAENVVLDRWIRQTLTMDEFIDNMGRGEAALEYRSSDNKLLLTYGWNNGGFNIYLGNIELIEKADKTSVFDAETASTMDYRSCNASKWNAQSEIVKNADLPVSGYDGDALKVTVTSPSYFYATLNYTGEEITAIAAENKYTHIRINYMLSDTAIGAWGQVDGALPLKSLTVGAWSTMDVAIVDFVSKMGASLDFGTQVLAVKDNDLFLFSASWGNLKPTLYLGDMEFVTKLPTLLDASSADTTALRRAGSTSWGTVLSTKVAKADLPVAGYDGDALKISLGTKNYTYAILNYGAQEITELAQEYGVTHIRVNYLVTGGGGPWYEPLGFLGSPVRESWQQLDVPVAEFVAALGEVAGGSTGAHITDNCLFLHYNGYTNLPDLYLGNIEFVMPTAQA
ncbi:MAG: hypothetical protein IJX03_00515 [Clostridia bacterium]|nr:hypothetical protein [Clostridia bacterium]